MLLRTVLVAGALVAATSLQAPRALAAQGGFGLAPAHFDPADPATRTYFKLSVDPGGTLSDQVTVVSFSDRPLRLLVDAVDGRTSETTGSVYANRQDPVQSTGAWVSPALSQLTLQPRARATAGFTVRVPKDASPGDHLAGIAFENAEPQTSGGQFAVTLVTRAVIGILVRVTGPAQPFSLRIFDIGWEPPSGDHPQAAVVAELANTGQLLGKPYLRAEVFSPGYQRKVERQLDTILPGDTIRYRLPWPEEPKLGPNRICLAWGADPTTVGPPTCRAVTEAGSVTALGRTGGGQPVQVRGSNTWWALIAVGLASVLLSLIVLRRRRRSRRSEARGS